MGTAPMHARSGSSPHPCNGPPIDSRSEPLSLLRSEFHWNRITVQRREVTVLQHESNESGGLFEEFARERGMGLLHVPVFETNEIPPISSTHLLVMGGPMSVNDEEELPWLNTEKQIIRERVMKGQPVLGICLGAQLIASSFGAAVYPCEPELGWSSVTAVNTTMFPELPGQFRVFQMHGETFDIPEGAALVYRGESVPSQAICIGKCAWSAIPYRADP